jgi:hypothetical protein
MAWTMRNSLAWGLATALLLCSSARAAEWVKMASNKTQTHYLDTESIRMIDRDKIEVWLKILRSQPAPSELGGNPVSYTLALGVFRRDRRYLTIEAHCYDVNRQFIGSLDVSKWGLINITPNTAYDHTYRYLFGK